MAHDICPLWVGYLLINPLRKLYENPQRMLRPFVREGMTVLEPGCGMGYFTLPLARLVGPGGRVVVVEVQAKMLSRLRVRAGRAGLMDRIDMRQSNGDGLGIEDLTAAVDFAAALHLVHEVPDQDAFFAEVRQALKPGGRLLVVEPKLHVSEQEFEESLAAARRAGFQPDDSVQLRGRSVLLVKPRSDSS